MKVKPFEILAGNSGSGKTKLTQLFAKYIAFTSQEKYVKVKGQLNYSSWRNMGWTLEKSHLNDFLPIKEYESNLISLWMAFLQKEGLV